MKEPIIYIQAEQSSYLNHPRIRIRDVCSVFCQDRAIQEKIKDIEIYRFGKEKEGRAFLSILVLVQEIAKVIPSGEVRSVGEQDIIIYYRHPDQKTNPWTQKCKIVFVCLTCFLGMGISIMGYNNDVDMSRVCAQLYATFLGTEPDGPTFLELFYSIGVALGVFLFFNHAPGKKVTNELTPLQVQMRLYEKDVNQTFLIGAARKGEKVDV
ncbi:MAG: stage V sporulation protein AA [Clostridiales bacterium]|nr:stage V sporulation protein AA [Clostridiales bacterium]